MHFELFPSTTKYIESFCSLLAAEASLRERPIKILLPADAHYAWTNVLAQYEAHPYFKSIYLSMDDDRILKETRFRPGDLVVGVYTPVHKSNCRGAPPPQPNHGLHAIRRRQHDWSPDSLIDLHTGG